MPYNIGQYSSFKVEDRKLFYIQMKLFQLAYTCSDYKIFIFLDQLTVQFTFKYSYIISEAAVAYNGPVCVGEG
jgi:hypothetical protein